MVKQYVGARYVPKFATPVEWAADTSYEALTIVTFNNASYTSKVQVPPTVGNPANNPQYWALTGNYNAQVEEYRQETETVSNNLNTEITNRKNAIAKLPHFVTPEMYGAVGDGVEDDTKAFQSAIDTGYPVCASRRYKISKGLKNVHSIIGYPQATIILTDNTENILNMSADRGNQSGCRIENLTLKFETAGSGNGVQFGNVVYQMCIFHSLRFLNCHDGLNMNGGGSLYSSHIYDCIFTNFTGTAIYLINIGSSGNFYSNIYIHSNNNKVASGIRIEVANNETFNNINIEHATYCYGLVLIQCPNSVINNIHFEGADFIDSAIMMRLNTSVIINGLHVSDVPTENRYLFLLGDRDIDIVVNELQLATGKMYLLNTMWGKAYYYDIVINKLKGLGVLTNNHYRNSDDNLLIPRVFDGHVYEEIVSDYTKHNLDSSASETLFKLAKYGDSIEWFPKSSDNYKNAVCIGTGIETDKEVTNECIVTQYSSDINIPTSITKDILPKNTAIKINGDVYITTSDPYKIGDHHAVNLNKPIGSGTTSGTYTLFKTSAVWKKYNILD